MKTPMSKAEAGRLGGQATLARHGVEHMRAIGKKGFAALATFARGGQSVALAKLAEWGKIRPRHPIDHDADYGFEALYESITAGVPDEEIPY